MKSFISSLFGLTLLILTLLILEGACFRLVENYAKSRLELAWGKPGQGKFSFRPEKDTFGSFYFPTQSTFTTIRQNPLGRSVCKLP